MRTLAPIPEIGQKCWFYPNDIIQEKNKLVAIVKQVYQFWDSAQKIIYVYDDYLEDIAGTPLMDLWMEHQKELFWILAEDTDYIIELSVPDLCQQPVYVARDQDGGWHSFELLSDKEFGILETDNSDTESENDDLPLGIEYYM